MTADSVISYLPIPIHDSNKPFCNLLQTFTPWNRYTLMLSSTKCTATNIFQTMKTWVHPLNPVFVPGFLCVRKVSIIGYGFTKLGIGSEDLQDLMVTRLDQWRVWAAVKKAQASKANPKLTMKPPLRTNLGEKTNLVPCFPLCTALLLISSPVLKKLGPSTPSLKNILDGSPEWTSTHHHTIHWMPLTQLSSTWTSIELTSSLALVTQCSIGSPHI